MSALLLVSLFVSLFAAAGSRDADSCMKYGFDSKVLECSTCDIVQQSLHNKEITQICSEFCSNHTFEKVHKAYLEYDESHVPSALVAFVEVYASDFKHLQLRPKKDASATLRLTRKNGDTIEEFSVADWTSQELADYLKERL